MLNKENEILSQLTVFMKYARYLPEKKRRETWEEIVTRNMEMHIRKFPFLEDEIRKNYRYVFEKKVLPSMRSLQFGGKPIEINPVRAFNCTYAPIDDIRVFSEAMFLLLSGCGFGFSVQKHHIEQLPEIRKPNAKRTRRFLIGDSIEGWADSIKVLIRSYFEGSSKIVFDFGDIRQKGSRLVTSGGKAPGAAPLKEVLVKLENILDSKQDGDKLSSIECHDMICFIADAVLSGGIRRASAISFFSADDDEMLSAKTGKWYEENPQRARANNSVVLMRHKITQEFFNNLWERIEASRAGEPGFYFTNDKDVLGNPCQEISLRSCGVCNLSTINASTIEDQEDYENRTKAAAFIATMQASYTNFHYLRDAWQRVAEKEALLGISMTGIASNVVTQLDMKKAAKLAVEENKRVANLIGINHAARVTCVKPEGTASLVLGTSSGIHAWHNDYYIRRMRVMKNEAIYLHLYLHHPELIEDDYFRPHDTAIIKVPQMAPENAVLRTESSIDLLERIKKVHTDWIKPAHIKGPNTHNVSATVSIKDGAWQETAEWMWNNRNFYNGLSVLPQDTGTYIQAPFSDCSKEEYEELMKSLTELDLTTVVEYEDLTDLQGEIACGGTNGCTIV